MSVHHISMHADEELRRLSRSDLRPVRLRDFKAACKAQKPSVQPEEIQRYVAYDAKHGAQQAQAHGAGASQSSDEW